jgi:hypothetical protein
VEKVIRKGGTSIRGGTVEEPSKYQEVAGSCSGALEDATPHYPCNCQSVRSEELPARNNEVGNWMGICNGHFLGNKEFKGEKRQQREIKIK